MPIHVHSLYLKWNIQIKSVKLCVGIVYFSISSQTHEYWSKKTSYFLDGKNINFINIHLLLNTSVMIVKTNRLKFLSKYILMTKHTKLIAYNINCRRHRISDFFFTIDIFWKNRIMIVRISRKKKKNNMFWLEY